MNEVTFADARGNRNRSDFTIAVARSLEEADIPALQGKVPVRGAPQRLANIRNSHHMLAQALARGHTYAEASLLTGYAPSYIAILQNDPAFLNLLSQYSYERELVFADVIQRLKVAGLSANEELMRRLESAPEHWSKKELMAFQELCLGRGGQIGLGGGGGVGSGGSPSVSVNVSFVEAKHQELPPLPKGEVIDVEGEDL